MESVQNELVVLVASPGHFAFHENDTYWFIKIPSRRAGRPGLHEESLCFPE